MLNRGSKKDALGRVAAALDLEYKVTAQERSKTELFTRRYEQLDGKLAGLRFAIDVLQAERELMARE